MSEPLNYIKLTSDTLTIQMYVRDDSHYLIVPIMAPARVKGWKIFDVATGTLMEHATFRSANAAKAWLEKEYPE